MRNVTPENKHIGAKMENSNKDERNIDKDNHSLSEESLKKDPVNNNTKKELFEIKECEQAKQLETTMLESMPTMDICDRITRKPLEPIFSEDEYNKDK